MTYHTTMQRAVERDSESRSDYAMCAVNPSRVSPTFSDAALREVVDSIATCTTSLLEIVNYNVEVSLALFTVIYLADFLRIYRVNNMCRRTHCFADYDKRSELSESPKD